MSIEKKTLIPRVGVASLSSPLEVGADRAPQAACDAAALLQAAGCQVVELGAIDRPEKSSAAGRKLAESHVHAVVLVAASWFEDYLVFDLFEECPVPLLLWSLPGMETGALCGVQQLTACLKQLGTPIGPCTDDWIRRTARSRPMRFLKRRRSPIACGGCGSDWPVITSAA